MKQTSNTVLMVRPANFGFNEETAVSNTFQNKLCLSEEELKSKVLTEFDNYVAKLRSFDLNVVVIEDTPSPIKPDAIFPNNWISFHEDGSVFMYPMCTPNRRTERRWDVLDTLEQSGFRINQVRKIDQFEATDTFLEGTGSMIFDRIGKQTFACISPRTDKALFESFCREIGYTPVSFYSFNEANVPIYHTNVMMCIASDFAVICTASITDPVEKAHVIQSLTTSGRRIVDITFDQVDHFAGNMLSLHKTTESTDETDYSEVLVMSSSAFNSLTPEQLESIKLSAEPVVVDITTIETIGGGSARCMLAEVFLPKNE